MKNRVPLSNKVASKEEGFAIPIALGMGLIMILLATTAVVKSQNGRVSAVNKRFTAQSLVAAETGIAKVQDFLNRNRAAISVQACSTTTNPYGACGDASPTESWKVPSKITNLCSATYAATTDAGMVDDNNWQDLPVPTGDVSNPKFRIVSYVPSSSQGVLTVEGILNSGATNEARSKVQVTLPIYNPNDELVGSLWVKGSIANSPQIDSDYIKGNACSSGNLVTFPSSSNRVAINTSQTMPDAMEKPTSKITTTLTVPYAATTTNIKYYELPNISTIPGKELPRTADQPDTNGVYRYIVTGTAANPFDDSLKITPGKKVWLWVKGNIDLTNRIIVNTCADESCGPFTVRIYPETTGFAGTLTLNKGTAICDVFFHLPDYSITFNNAGTNSTQNCGVSSKPTPATNGSHNTGVYWVNNWTSGSITGQTIIDAPRAKWSTALTSVTNAAGIPYMTKPPLLPQIGPPSQWDKQQSN
jgi:hypothetical protein